MGVVVRYDGEFDVRMYLEGRVRDTSGRVEMDDEGKWNLFVLTSDGMWRPYFARGLERKSDLLVKFKRDFLALSPWER